MNIKEIQDQINKLQESLDTLNGKTAFDWDNAPTIAEINGSRWLLGPATDVVMRWAAATDWCKSVGGELPPREVSVIAYVNEEIRDLFTAANYWSSTEFTATTAWTQNFLNGFQYYFSKPSRTMFVRLGD